MSLLARWRDYQFHKNLWKEDERMLLLQARTDGEEHKAFEIARKMIEMGDPFEKIHIVTGLSAETIERL